MFDGNGGDRGKGWCSSSPPQPPLSRLSPQSAWHTTPHGCTSRWRWWQPQADQVPRARMGCLAGRDPQDPQGCQGRLAERGGRVCQACGVGAAPHVPKRWGVCCDGGLTVHISPPGEPGAKGEKGEKGMGLMGDSGPPGPPGDFPSPLRVPDDAVSSVPPSSIALFAFQVPKGHQAMGRWALQALWGSRASLASLVPQVPRGRRAKQGTAALLSAWVLCPWSSHSSSPRMPRVPSAEPAPPLPTAALILAPVFQGAAPVPGLWVLSGSAGGWFCRAGGSCPAEIQPCCCPTP